MLISCVFPLVDEIIRDERDYASFDDGHDHLPPVDALDWVLWYEL
jgi:hypothetical protein